MKRVAVVALLVGLVALHGCGGPEVETETQSASNIEDHRIDGIDRLKITYNTEIDDRFQQYKRTTNEEHYIDFSTQIIRKNCVDYYEQEGYAKESTYVEFIIDDLKYRIGQYESDLCITSPFFSLERPWAMGSFEYHFVEEFQNEVIAGVECEVTGDTFKDGTWKRWIWNGIVLKEIQESPDKFEKMEAVGLVINPAIEGGFFELPDHLEIITQLEYDERVRENMRQLMEQEESE